MPNPEELIQALRRTRPGHAGERDQHGVQPPSRPGPAGKARPRGGAGSVRAWLAQRHMETDAAIERVVYLPTGAPNNEIRLLEVNRFLRPPDNDVIEPLDFTPDIAEVPFRVFVADVTRDQWERIQRDPKLLAHLGWQTEGNQIYTRG